MNLWNITFKPMLLKEVTKVFNSDKYLYEIKYDGIRVLVYVSPSILKIINRNLNDVTYLFPEMQELKNKVSKKVIFDGEIICEDDGLPSFSKLQERLHLKDKNKINISSTNNPITFIAFDILYENKALINKSLIERKKILEKYENDGLFIKSFFIENDGINLFKKIKKYKLEGIVAKRKDGKYYINMRSDEWIKIKNFKTEFFYIGGYNDNKSKFIISVLLGEYRNDLFYFVGKMSLSKKHVLYEKIINNIKIKSPFINYNGPEIFIKPIYKIKVSYLERTKNNNLRQPFIGK